MRCLIAFFVICHATAFIAQAQPVQRDYVEAELIAADRSIQPGRSLRMGVRLKLDQDWHVYWRNPGDSGTPPQISWRLPPGFVASDIDWPAPHRFEAAGLINYGYANEVLLPVTMTVPADVSDASVTLAADVSWLVCREECIPGKATLALTLPVTAEQPEPDAQWAELFAETHRQIPVPMDATRVSARLGGKANLVVSLTVEGLNPDDPVDFYPADGQVTASAVKQSLHRRGSTTILSLPVSSYARQPVDRLRGVLIAGNNTWAIDVPIPEPATFSDPIPNQAPKAPHLLLLYAFLGGVLLNLMPCVFPVLSIKILGFVRQAGEDRRRVLHHGLHFGAGVLVSFWIMTGVLLALRASGEKLGWGFQLQSPPFVAAMALLMLLVGLNFLGAFTIGIGVMNLAGRAQGRVEQGYSGSFFSGVLAVVIATPCTAPFMGTAVGVALTLPMFATLVVFTALGLGMALPYVLLSAFPRWLNLLPRPGAWMETFKQAMAFPMFAAAIWLVWVFGQLSGGATPMMVMLLGLLLAALAAWLFGRRPGYVTGIIGVALLILAVALPVRFVNAADGAAELQWQAFSDARVDELRRAGRVVFVDFTADWCFTCKVNEGTVLASDSVAATFREHDVALLKADWTKEDPHITAALARFGRAGVPLYVVYPPGIEAEPAVLPTILTTSTVTDAIKIAARPLAKQAESDIYSSTRQ